MTLKNALKLFILIALTVSLALVLSSCDVINDSINKILGNHEHELGEWETTKEPTCALNGEKTRSCECGYSITESISSLEHSFGTDGKCSFCGSDCIHEDQVVVKGKDPNCTEIGYTDGRKCEICGETTVEQQTIPPTHAYNASNVCTVCGVGGPNGKYPWVKTDITVQLCESDWFAGHSAGLKRYCAGEDTTATEKIDTLVRQRNEAAYAEANVNVTYQYKSSYGYGGMYNALVAELRSGSALNVDIVSNFTYDMTYCALNGFFANLYANTSKTSTAYGNGGNYFAFNEVNYFDASQNVFDANFGEGYFFDYMQSLCFVNTDGEYDKMYLLASNYTLDFIRAMQIIPVNTDLLSSISADSLPCDSDGNGIIDINELYDTVWDYGWTYDTLAALSNAVYNDDNTTVEGKDIKDTLGFCLAESGAPESGAPASGLFYSSGVGVITKMQYPVIGWTYDYLTENEELCDFTAAVGELVANNQGVYYLSNSTAAGANIGESKNSLEAIHYRFSENKLLFGGITPIGTFETELYKAMNQSDKSGFGFVPVPLYIQVYDNDGNVDLTSEALRRYNTDAYNSSRVFAISAGTTSFEQCTAFLDYLSSNSADIVNEYAYSVLVPQNEQTNESHSNVKMLNYIKNHTLTAFEKTYDEIIVNDNSNFGLRAWHQLLYLNGYSADFLNTMGIRYSEMYPHKSSELQEVLQDWERLK